MVEDGETRNNPRDSTSSPGRESKLSKLGTRRTRSLEGIRFTVCLSVCQGLSPRSLLPLTPSSSALHPPFWVGGSERDADSYGIFFPRESYCKEAGRGWSSGGEGEEEMRAGFQAAESRAGLWERAGGSLFLGKPP